jgi:hypothetical protein
VTQLARRLQSVVGALHDQLALELGNRGQDVEHQLAGAAIALGITACGTSPTAHVSPLAAKEYSQSCVKQYGHRFPYLVGDHCEPHPYALPASAASTPPPSQQLLQESCTLGFAPQFPATVGVPADTFIPSGQTVWIVNGVTGADGTLPIVSGPIGQIVNEYYQSASRWSLRDAG